MNEKKLLQKLNKHLDSGATEEKVQISREELKSLLAIGAKYSTLHQVGKLISSEMEFDRLMRLAMDQVIEVTRAQRGFIALVDEQGNIDFAVARNIKKSDISKPHFQVSRSIIDRVIASGEPICLSDAVSDSTFAEEESVMRLQLLSVLCVPIKIDTQMRGLIYVDNSDVRSLFDDAICELISAFSEQVAIALKNATLYSELKKSHRKLADELRDNYQFDDIIGSGPRMTEILTLVADVANTDATILIQGENGTGKGLIARALHFNSDRGEKPFVRINCGAMPPDLVESELFGHVKGAFTGAIKDKRGKFVMADSGTIFLDEVGEMPLSAQVKLLSILENGAYSPVGSEEEKRCDVRVIAATNRDLAAMMKEKSFREDLYYRLNVINLIMPALRERKEDIPLLVNHFIECHNKNTKKPGVSTAVEHLLANFDYPGNVRQLENIVQRAVILCKGRKIESQHLPDEIRTGTTGVDDDEIKTFTQRKQKAIEKFEQDELVRLLILSGGKVRKSARLAGMDVKNFSDKLKRYGINSSDYKSQ